MTSPGGIFHAAVVQAAPVAFDVAATLAKVARLTGESAAGGATLVVFPEAFVSCYPRGLTFGAAVGSRTPQGRDWFRRYWESSIDVPGPAVDRLGAIAREHAVHLAMMRHIACEGRCFVLSANQFARRSDDPDDSPLAGDHRPSDVLCRGASIIVSPLGEILAGPQIEGEAILRAEPRPDHRGQI